jgi:hypothetical protein
MIHEEICTYELCKLAKEKGFNVQTFDWYDYTGNYNKGFIPHKLHECPRYKEYYAPSQSLLQRWLREERGIIVEVFMDDDSNMPLTYNIHQYKDLNWECVCHHHGNYYAVTDWELCLEDALKYVLKNLV